MPEIPQVFQFSRSQISIGWPKMLFVTVLVVLLTLTAAQFLIARYEYALTTRSQDIELEIQNLAGVIPETDLSRLTKLDQQIRNLKLLLESHVYLSHALDELEALTLPQVRYVSVGIDRAKTKISIIGIAPSMDAVGMQAAAFSQSPSIQSVAVNSANIAAAGRILFNFEIVFADSLIQPPLQ